MVGEKVVKPGRLDGKQRNLLKGLLNMMYRPSELADEIGINKNQVYAVYIENGCPHERDSLNHIWINGQVFKEWYQETYKKYQPKENEVYCPSCKTYQVMSNPERYVYSGNKTEYDLYVCPNCGKPASKIVGRGG